MDRVVLPDEPPAPYRAADGTMIARRRDLYALSVIAAAHELVAGVAGEIRADRPINAIRLARHLAEFELQSRWVMSDPEHRVELAEAETMRNICERLPAGSTEHLGEVLGHAKRVC